MRKLLVIGTVLLFSALAFAGSADASHEKYIIRYVTGSGSGLGVLYTLCVWTVEDTTYAAGGACTHPCPHGTCDITIVDDHNGNNVWFRVQIDDEEFFRPQFYYHQASIEGDTVRVAPIWNDVTTGIITIE